jgi:hypothetical protein
MPKIHELKCWPQYFRAVRSGAKNFELRLDDRGFNVGDRLKLREWNPEGTGYTGAEYYLSISYVLRLKNYMDLKGWGWAIARRLMPNLVILALDADTGASWAHDQSASFACIDREFGSPGGDRV